MFSIAASHRRLAAAVVVGVVASLGAAVASAAPATAPVRVVVDSITSDVVIPAGLPTGAVPYVVVGAGGTVTVHVSFLDVNNQPAAFTKDTRLTVSSNVGTLTVSTGLAAAGEPTATIRTGLTAAVNRVVLTVAAGSGPKAPAPGTSYVPAGPGAKDLRFDVLSAVSPLLSGANGSAFVSGFGGEDGCVQATETAPVCEVLRLPRGSGSDVLLTVGACDANTQSVYAPCFKGAKGVVGGAVVQALFAQPTAAGAAPYSIRSPATVVVKCDKTLCGTGSIRSRTVLWSLGGNAPLVAAVACPGKNTMAAAGTPCVDYVQSTRDGSGDTHLYLLTDGDIRTGIG